MKKIYLLIAICSLIGCTKKLDLKPDSTIVLPKTVQDLERILDNSIFDQSPGLPQISADEYFLPSKQDWESTYSITTRNGAIWEKDIYQGETKIYDWSLPYQCIFYSNSILDLLASQDITNDSDRKRIKGWALFSRAYAFYNLVSIFSKGYNEATSSTDLGVPLKLTSGVDEILQRSTVKQTYDQIIKDATDAGEFLQEDIIMAKRNRPSKVASFAFLARVFLSMRKYDSAELYANKALALYSKLTDFNNLDKNAPSAFTNYSEEIIYHTLLEGSYSEFSFNGITTGYGVNLDLISLYDPSDLRLPIYFQKNTIGNYNMKPINSISVAPFTGLATDELYLIKSECLARRAQTQQSMDVLNQLVSKRWNPNATTPAKPYQNITAANPEAALSQVLLERRKSLVWRSLRWTDLKRLNLEGRNITITRNLGGTIYTLEPNSSRYILPIPGSEISLSGIQQNQR